MIKLINKKKTVAIPNSWDELTPDQFMGVLRLCNEVMTGAIDMLDFRLKLFKFLTNYKPGLFTMPKHREQIESNIFNLAMMLKFPLHPVYENPELLEVFTTDLREALQTSFPFDIYEPDHLQQLEMLGDNLKWSPMLNLDFGRNLLPTIEVDGIVLHGPQFDTVADSFDTDLRTGEYIDAMDWSMLYESTKNEAHLNKFIATLYRPSREIYNPSEVTAIAEKLNKLSPETKSAIMLMFGFFAKQIASHHLYSLFFTGEKTDENNSNPIGLNATVFAISSDGLGSRDEILNWPLPVFYNSMYYRLSKAVEAMRKSGLDDAKINRETGISFETLEKL